MLALHGNHSLGPLISPHPPRDPSVIESAQHHARQLISLLGSFPRVVVAFSGGVDSSVVAAAAQRADPQKAIAVTAQSPSVAKWQIEIACNVAKDIGIEHHIMPTAEGQREAYRRNNGRRCFFCKQTLYESLGQFTRTYPDVTVASGTNADDLGDYRPGIEAGKQAKVITPLADLGLTKADVRELAAYFGLSNKDLPASPCLASRIAYGTEVTPQRLRRIEQAEDWLRRQGFEQLRVRLHEGEMARIEVPRDQIPILVELDSAGVLTRRLRSFGFRAVTIDCEGFRSGNMNRALVTLDTGTLDTVTLDTVTLETGTVGSDPAANSKEAVR